MVISIFYYRGIIISIIVVYEMGMFQLELEGVPGYPSTRESYVRFAGRSPISTQSFFTSLWVKSFDIKPFHSQGSEKIKTVLKHPHFIYY